MEEGCLICNKPLVYNEIPKKKQCSFCNDYYESEAECIDHHFICDECHSSEGVNIIENICLKSIERNPILLAIRIMHHPAIKMHGPEHHYLVGAVLITGYYNITGRAELKKYKLSIAKKRAAKIPGGFCGFYGNCGAAVSTGIFISLITNSTPLSTDSWGMCNLITAKCLKTIGENGGPRCCKRDTYHSILEAADFVSGNLGIDFEIPAKIVCEFFERNKECLKNRCKFYPQNN